MANLKVRNALSNAMENMAEALHELGDTHARWDGSQEIEMIEGESEGRSAIDDFFGPATERVPFVSGSFDRIAGEEDLLIRKSKRDLWALTEDGSEVVRLFDPDSEPIILEKTASLEDRDMIRTYARMARRQLLDAGQL